MKHLHSPGSSWDSVWCPAKEPGQDYVDDPFEADCTVCLRQAAMYGAKAAVRCAGIESRPAADEELQAERDVALQDATIAKRALMDRNLFICQECKKTRSLSLQAGYQVPGDPPLVWCDACKAKA